MLAIKELRCKKRMAQSRVARALNVSQQAVAKWESGEQDPRAGILPKLAKILDCTIDELFGVEPDRKEDAG